MISRCVVLDTNILVSAALKEFSNPAEILKKIISKEIVTLICPSIVSEYREIFSRKKFNKFKFPPLWFEYFLSRSIWIDSDPPQWPLHGPDPDDLVFLSLAFHQGATLITGNLKDYPVLIRRNTSVVDPSTYLHWFKSPNQKS